MPEPKITPGAGLTRRSQLFAPPVIVARSLGEMAGGGGGGSSRLMLKLVPLHSVSLDSAYFVF